MEAAEGQSEPRSEIQEHWPGRGTFLACFVIFRRTVFIVAIHCGKESPGVDGLMPLALRSTEKFPVQRHFDMSVSFETL